MEALKTFQKGRSKLYSLRVSTKTKEGEVYKYHIVNNDLNKAILDVVDAIKDNMK